MEKSRRRPDVIKRIRDTELGVWMEEGDKNHLPKNMNFRFYYSVNGEERVASCFKLSDIKDMVACLNWVGDQCKDRRNG